MNKIFLLLASLTITLSAQADIGVDYLNGYDKDNRSVTLQDVVNAFSGDINNFDKNIQSLASELNAVTELAATENDYAAKISLLENALTELAAKHNDEVRNKRTQIIVGGVVIGAVVGAAIVAKYLPKYTPKTDFGKLILAKAVTKWGIHLSSGAATAAAMYFVSDIYGRTHYFSVDKAAVSNINSRDLLK